MVEKDGSSFWLDPFIHCHLLYGSPSFHQLWCVMVQYVIQKDCTHDSLKPP